MNKLTLYWSLGSQPGRSVKTLLDIGKIQHDAIRVNVVKKQHKSQEFLKMYPIGRIPVLKDGDFVIGQSSAILTYLCEKYPHISHYHGKDIRQRAIVNQYLSYYQSEFRPALFRPFKRFLVAAYWGKPITDESQIKNLWKEMWVAISQLNRLMALNNTKYIGGNYPSIADFLYFYELTNLTYFKTNIEQYKQLTSWFQRVYEIAEVKNIMSEWQVFAKARAQDFSKIREMNDKQI